MKVKREVVDFLKDEHIRHGVDAAGMAKLPTIFKKDGGTVTAGNASGMNDAGAALVLMSDDEGRRARRAGACARARLRVVWRGPRDHGHRPGPGGPQGA